MDEPVRPYSAGGSQPAVRDSLSKQPAKSARTRNAAREETNKQDFADRPSARGAGQDVAETSFFTQALGDGGSWVPHRRFGNVWRPRVDEKWRPYNLGRWVYADDFGWTWISDEPFGWAVYHYGRWSLDPELGWIWVPGTEWAPAWVAWRRGEEAIGWAPLPPHMQFRNGHITGDPSELERETFERTWTFVRPRYFARPEMRRYVRPVSWNAELIWRTSPKIDFAAAVEAGDDRIINRGLAPEDVEKLASFPVPRVKLKLVNDPRVKHRDQFGEWRSRDIREVRIYRPEKRIIDEAAKQRPRTQPQLSEERPEPRSSARPRGAPDGPPLPPAPPGAGHQLNVGETSSRRDTTPALAEEPETRKRTGTDTARMAPPSNSSAAQGVSAASSEPPPSTGSIPGKLSSGKRRWDGSGPSGAGSVGPPSGSEAQ